MQHNWHAVDRHWHATVIAGSRRQRPGRCDPASNRDGWARRASLGYRASREPHLESRPTRGGVGHSRRLGLSQNPRRSAPSVAAQASIAFSRSQQRKRSLYAAALAAQLVNECGGLCTPALKNPADQPLTDRQREIIELAAAGLSNKEIADCLVTSVRTVEGHVYRAYQRLGAKSRDELVSIMRGGPARLVCDPA